MLRPLNIAAVLLVVVTFVGLYRLSYEVRQLDRELATINQNVLDEARAIRLLEAEWSYLNRPARLEVLSSEISLAPMSPDQFKSLSDLPEAEPEEIEARKKISQLQVNFDD